MKHAILHHQLSYFALKNVCIETVSRETLLSPELFLTESEQELRKRVLEEKQEAWCMGRLAAKRALQSFAQTQDILLSLPDIAIHSADNGAPYAIISSSSLPFHFSLSHTVDFAAAGVVSHYIAKSIGIDVERIQTFSPATIKDFLTDSEYELFLHSENPAFFATQYWCLKEAYLKARKVGLRIHPRRIQVAQLSTHIEFMEDGVSVPTETYWTVIDGLYMLASVQLMRTQI